MKIISKFKDYYDYKVADYGIDENLIYDRRNGTIVDRQRISPIPLLLITNDYRTKNRKVYINPSLQELGIYIDRVFVWQHIVQYLSDLKTQAEQSPELPNELKIDSKGFDKKRSFRPKMK